MHSPSSSPPVRHSNEPIVVFASPRKLPRAGSLSGRVVVVDIAFAAESMGKGFAHTTGKLIDQLGARLARWVDHHDHPLHERFRRDPRFVLATKAEHGACPEMNTPELVRDSGPIDTIVAHFDLDGVYAAAKWILDGVEPYPGADDDARAIDTRVGHASNEATRIDMALRAHWQDEVLRQRILGYLIRGLRPGIERDSIERAARDFADKAERSRALGRSYRVEHGIAVLNIPANTAAFDKTELLLIGQTLAEVAVVVDAGNVSIAAPFESGLDFVHLLELGGGMPTRVSIPAKRLSEALERIRQALELRSR